MRAGTATLDYPRIRTGMDENLYDLYLEAALQGHLHQPAGFLRRHGCDDPALLAKLRRVYGQLAGSRDAGSVDAGRPPDEVAGFRLLCPIGRGSFGEVYEGRDPTGEPCAVKLLRLRVRPSARHAERFLREIEALRRLAHPNLVRLLAGGEADGLLFLAMELVPGQTLRALVRDELPAPERAIAWCVELARALHHVHEEGFLHRDVKPGNVMLRPDGRPVLLDFGLALDTLSDLATLTRGFVGTPAYAAPEQRAGLRRAVSVRSDLYGLAATLYFCLTGRAPFGGRGKGRRLLPVAAERPVSAALDELLLRSLAEDPGERPASLAAFARALEEAGRAPVRKLPPRVDSLDALSDEDFTRTHKLDSVDAPTLPVAELAFELLEAIGRGGNAVVYRALQTRLAREVAVKVLREPGATQRGGFLAEAQLASRLEHPNILPVYDLLESPGGAVQLAMKLVDGETWSARLARDGSSRDEHLEILASVCNAVAFAHSRGVLHNDLKPSNVLLGPFGEVLLCDWGVAVELHPGSPRAVRTQASIELPCGTPAYMSPELAAGDGAALSPRSDVFLLGGILYTILEGRPPNTRERLRAYLDGSVSAAPPLAPEIPAPLAALCRAALAPDRRQRPASVEEFQQALRAWFRHREAHALLDAARARLEACRAEGRSAPPNTGARAEEARARRYEGFSEAIAAFVAARAAHDSEAARSGEEEARRALAESALQAGDFGLCRTQLARLPETSGQALRRALEAGLTQRGRDRRARRTLRRVLVGAGLVLLAVAATVFVVRERDAERVRTSYEAANSYASSAMRGLFRVSSSLGGELMEELGSTRSETAVRELQEAALLSWRELLGTGHGAEPRQRMLMHARIATLLLRLEPQSSEVDAHHAEVDALLSRLAVDAPENRGACTEVRLHRVEWLRARARWSALEREAERGLAGVDRLDGSDTSREERIFWRFHFLSALSAARHARGDLEGAARQAGVALDELRGEPGLRPRERFEQTLRLAELRIELGALQAARALLEPLVDELETWRMRRPGSVLRRELVLDATWVHARLLDLLGQPEAACALLERAREQLAHLRERFADFPPYRRRTVAVLHVLGATQRRLGHTAAAQVTRAALARAVGLLDPAHVEDRAVLLLARAELALGAPAAEAEEAARATLETLRASLRALRDVPVSDGRGGIARAALSVAEETVGRAGALGRGAVVLEVATEVSALAESSGQEPGLRRSTARLWLRAARTLAGLGELDAAGHALAAAEERLPPGDADPAAARLDARAAFQRAWLLDAQGDQAQARARADQASAQLAALSAPDPDDELLRAEIDLFRARLAPAGAELFQAVGERLEELPPSEDRRRLRARLAEERGARAADPGRALGLAREAGALREPDRALGVTGVRACQAWQRLAFTALTELGREAEALEVGAALFNDFQWLLERPRPSLHDLHDAQLFARLFAVRLLAAGALDAVGPVCALGLAAGRDIADSAFADAESAGNQTVLAVARAQAAGARGDTEESRAWFGHAVDCAREAVARFGPDPALERALALCLLDAARTELAADPARALTLLGEARGLLEAIGEDGLLPAVEELERRARE